MTDIIDINAVYQWREYGDTEALALALENLDGRAPSSELIEAVTKSLRGEKPQKRSPKVANRDFYLGFEVWRLRNMGDCPRLEDAYVLAGQTYSVSDSTAKAAYQAFIRKRRKT